jgi:hypothetical protein
MIHEAGFGRARWADQQYVLTAYRSQDEKPDGFLPVYIAVTEFPLNRV